MNFILFPFLSGQKLCTELRSFEANRDLGMHTNNGGRDPFRVCTEIMSAGSDESETTKLPVPKKYAGMRYNEISTAQIK
jgi:hypothetical protein